jgi:prepilin-type N-terminal cleavage/methylation domain-containing protein
MENKNNICNDKVVPFVCSRTLLDFQSRISVKKRPLNDGFSLIELLVVVGILAVLTAFLMANVSAGRARARDAVRKSDFDGIKKALRLYYNDYQAYPASLSGEMLACGDGNDACDWGGAFSTTNSEYMKHLPQDPLNTGSNAYVYTQTSAGEGFLLTTYLENTGDESDGTSQLRCGVIGSLAAKTPQQYVGCEK